MPLSVTPVLELPFRLARDGWYVEAVVAAAPTGWSRVTFLPLELRNVTLLQSRGAHTRPSATAANVSRIDDLLGLRANDEDHRRVLAVVRISESLK